MTRIGSLVFLLKNIFTLTSASRFYDLVYEFVVENVWAKRTMHIDGKVGISSTARILYPENIFVGDRTNINRYCCLWASPNARIVIGKNCLLGPNVTMITSKYATEGKKNFRENAAIERDIIIEDDVWLGANVVVLPGVSIGRGSVIGAGTVVNRDVPSYSVVVGQEMRLIKSRK
jgi:maltose O-acetyltransferase